MIEAPTSGLRGRALIYPVLVIAGWSVGRAFALQSEPAPTEQIIGRVAPKAPHIAVRDPNPELACPFWPGLLDNPIAKSGSVSGNPQPERDGWTFYRPVRIGKQAPHMMRSTEQGAGSGTVQPLPFAQVAAAVPTVPTALTPANLPAAQRQRRIQLYGYSLWRQGSGSDAFAPAAQYGGSQAGLIATWDPFSRVEKGVALLARASATPDGNERELALGARWQLNRHWPISVSAERRFRLDGKDRFAFYAAGGVNDVAIIGKAKLDAYGQAGYVSGKNGGGFFDAHGRMLHPVATLAGLPLSAGAGAWAGGQPGVRRLDVGPTIATRVETRFADFTLQLDWRQRVAGNANPKDGLALTVSTGF
ncbi:hypothetical protein DXH95_12505 [Sphingorhabdus pulchriflava]|uniref:Uncharacterized protein n=1 Tax=Sphingorhabdus pulchriflava TaxID=2292257 RepID=A0A371B599_9SPHN|nr:hypothetical protein [Sphingorhabdus pulchriflava]RDV02759.1 hypothetical protein DXH95_12505 [Sphingorhabdus pulchriflava]